MSYPTQHKKLISWVEEIAALTTTDRIHWCDGSAEEYDRLCQEMVESGTFEKLSDAQLELLDLEPGLSNVGGKHFRLWSPLCNR